MTAPREIAFCPGDVLAVSERLARMIASRRGRLDVAAAAGMSSLSNSAGVVDRTVRGKLVRMVPVIGMMDLRRDFWGYGTSTQAVDLAVREAAGNAKVDALVLLIDSPGGSVYGLTELAETIRAARQRKPVIAMVSGLAASAAYSTASGATRIIASPSSELGSIGVYTMHEDWSRALDQQGVAVTLVHAGEGKVDGNPYKPLSDAARADMLRTTRRYYETFVGDVAAGRRVPETTVVNQWKARVYGAAEAVRLGLADSIGSLDGALREAALMAGTHQALDVDVSLAMRARERLVTAEDRAHRAGEMVDLEESLRRRARARGCSLPSSEAVARDANLDAEVADRIRMRGRLGGGC